MTRSHKHPTLSEVARLAGVGTTTVSRVINGGHRVELSTLARVRRAIDDLGYVPNHAARILKGSRTKTIGFLVPSVADPFFSSCAETAQAIARANESLLIVTTTQNDQQIEIDSINVLIKHRVDGLIIAPANSRSRALRNLFARLSVPVVAMDRPLSGSQIPSVLADNFTGANVATRHLIEHGYKRILCLTGETSLYTIRERMRGYRKAVETAGLASIIDTSIEDYNSAERALATMLTHPEPPDAVFVLKNSTTIHAFEALQKLRVSVPDTVALLGYDDFELAATLRPSITVVQQPVEEIGRITAELLFQMMHEQRSSGKDHERSSPRQVRLSTCLIRRASCGCISV